MKEMCEEFERRLLGSPNSSMLWIQYMSVLIKSMELDAARSLAQRALQTISIRAESEKLNIWIALMNLEHAYGTEASLKATFERACVYNDSKTVHLALAKIYEESAKAEQPETIKTVEDFYANNLMKSIVKVVKFGWIWLNSFSQLSVILQVRVSCSLKRFRLYHVENTWKWPSNLRKWNSVTAV